MGAFVLVGLAVILFVALMIVLSAVKIVPEYERGDVVSNGSPAPAVRS
jgi:regulator of protease activity HflC (stomatin/prohibitin superfamily)